jgi:hypothetical protein
MCDVCRDHDPQSEDWRSFYAGMQNKLLWVIAQMTGPELIIQRANADHPYMGLRTCRNDNIRKSDITIAKSHVSNRKSKTRTGSPRGCSIISKISSNKDGWSRWKKPGRR